MFRQVRRLLLLRCTGGIARGAARSLSSGPPPAPAQDAAFFRSRRRVAPHMKPPKTALSFLQHRPRASASIGTKFPVNLLPHTMFRADKEEFFQGSFFTEQSWTSGRRNEYKKFEKHLEDCDNIKDGMTIAEVLKLPEVDSFRTSLNKRDRLLCVWMHMTRLQKEEATSQFKAFLIHLLKPNLHLEIRKRSFGVVQEAFLGRYRYLPHQLITNSLRDLPCHIPQHELDGPQPEDTRKRIKKYVEKLYKKKCHARWFADPTKRFTAPYNYFFNSSTDEE